MPDETRPASPMPASPVPARPVPRAAVTAIAPYVPGRSKAGALAPGVTQVFKLSSNETPLGPSPQARAAYAAVADQLDLYPDGGATALREAIAARYGLDPARVLCGAGSDELLNLLGSAYLSPGDEGLYSQHGFLIYRSAIMAAGGVPVTAPERDLTVDVDALLARVTNRTRVVFLANPNNPTGTYLSADEVRRLHAGLRPDILLVLDAAYAEYVRRNDYSAGLELVLEHDNAVMTRTFSKIHGLAGLRLGWMVAPAHVVDALNRIRSPFNINAAAMAAGIAAIRDTAHVEAAIAHNERWLAWLAGEIAALGLGVTPSAGNFLCVHFPAGTAGEADAYLASRGLILRRIEAYGLPDALRLTVGGEEANRAVVAALREFVAGAR